jgi:site-specific DNA recombinase
MVSRGRRAATYARLSQDRSLEKVSVPRQIEECRGLAERNGWEVVEVFQDRDVSASNRNAKRPGYDALLRALRQGHVNAVLSRETSRLYRRPMQLEELIDLIEGKGVEISTLYEGEVDLSTPNGRMMARIRVAVDKQESERLGERVLSAKRQGRAVGKLLGGGRRPYGYRREPGNGLVIDEVEAAIIREAARRVIEKGETVNRIAVDFNARDIPTSGGLRWRPMHLRRLLVSPLHAGIVSHDGAELGPGQWPAILSADEHRVLVARLARKSEIGESETGERLGARKHVLSGLVFCGKCHTKMYSADGMYRCSATNGGCNKISVSSRRLESYVHDAALDHGEKVARRAVDDSHEEPGPSDDEVTAEMVRLEAESYQIGELLGEGKLLPKIAVTASTRIEKRLEDLRSQLSKPTSAQPPKEELAHLTLGLLDRWEKRSLTPADAAKLNATFEGHIRRILVGPGSRGSDLDDRVAIEWVGA